VSTHATDTWTTRRLLDWMSRTFEQRDLDSPRLSAEILVSNVVGCERLRLYMDPDRPASPDERDRLRDLVKRALNHEPIQYLTGEAWFFGLKLRADRRALIPRPSTETIIEHVLQAERTVDRGRPARIADVCTGSGCVAVALAKHLPGAEIVASDVSAEALGLARENAEQVGVESRVELVEGDLLGPIAGAASEHGPFDWVVTNPPYIPDHEWDAVEPNVKDHEPHLALRAGPDGLRHVTPIVGGAMELLTPGGTLLVEIAACTSRECLALAERAGYAGARIVKDHEGLDRVLIATRPA